MPYQSIIFSAIRIIIKKKEYKRLVVPDIVLYRENGWIQESWTVLFSHLYLRQVYQPPVRMGCPA